MKKNLWALLAIFLVMTVLPWGAVAFAPGDAGMAICFVLFFGVNMICSLYIGIWSGLAVKQRWYLPIVNAGAFLISAWLIFTAEEPLFAGYAAAYLALGGLSMAVTVLVARGIRKERKE